MGRYVARRLLQFIPVFLGATFLIYAAVYAIPGDPIRALFGDRYVAPSTVNALREQYNLNDPLVVQYVKYLWGLVQGDFGQTFNGQDVWDIMVRRIPRTVRLALVAFGFEMVIGVFAGILAALRKNGFWDNLVLVSTTLVISIPVFVLGFIAQLVFGVGVDIGPINTGWFPVAYRPDDGWFAYLMPGLVLGAVSLAFIARLMRSNLVDNLRADYVRTATSKGLTRRRVVGIHALRNSLIPVVTFLGVDLGNLMGGAIVTEGIFNIPGLGQQVFQSIRSQEGAVVVGIVTFLVLIFLTANLLVDILYAYLDPRIRYE